MKRSIVDILKADSAPQKEPVIVEGWLRTKRQAKGFSFLEINDGSSLANLQAVADEALTTYQAIKEAGTGAALRLTGNLAPSQGSGQRWELVVTEAILIGPAGPDYPLQKKGHSAEFLREIAHLRPRTNKFGAIFRLRSHISWAIHDFFRQRGFFYVHTPIITGSDCEGAGEMFRVTTLAPGAKEKDDFFGDKEASLTVSGQLEGELLALALGKIYTFGPTFRAENSNTPRHAAEFWMIEPEVAFADLPANMDLAEDLVKHLVTYALENCQEDLELFDRFVEPGLLLRLKDLLTEFVRLPYTEAIEILEKSGQKWEYPVTWGSDLQTEHERYLCETHFQKPVFVYDYPATIKPFYMRLSADGRTVAAMDLLVPKVGELVGGSQREERLDILTKRMDEMGLNQESYWWYLDSRRFGSAPHSGFGLGFERFLLLLTGVGNIRDVIPFPRTPKNLEF